MTDPNKPVEDRAFVATLAGNYPTTQMLSALSATLEDPHAAVTIHALRSLGLIGSLETLPTIASLCDSTDTAIRSTARFAHLLISHRHGKSSDFYHPAGARRVITWRGGSIPFVSSTVTQATAGEMAGALCRYPTLPPMHARACAQVHCGPNRWGVLLAVDVLRAGIHAFLRREPALVGVMVAQNEEDQSWSVSRFILGDRRS